MFKPVSIALLITLTAIFVVAQATAPAAPPTTMPPVPKIAALPPAAEQAMASIDSEKIRAQVKFLSHDLLEGRGTGQRGGDVAAQYIATQFELYRLKPAGDNGTYLQKVPMVGITTEPSSTFSLLPAKGEPIALRGRDDIVAMDETSQPSIDIDAPIIWMGYGIDAPEFNWNDYKGVDVKGKVLLMLVNEPPSNDPKFFGGPALTYYGRWTYKYEQAARMGAVGVLLIHKTEMASYGWDVVRNSWSGERSYLRSDSAPKLKMASWIHQDIARKLAQDCGKNLDDMMAAAAKPGFKAESLPAKFKAHIVSQVRPFDSNNVVAMLPGSDPTLKEQGIVYSAHYDHFGIVPGMPGDNIFNGAQDNATGVAIVLEIARAYAEAKTPPKRSIYFVSVTAEEQGLLGSNYFGKNPPVPAKLLSLGLNFDDIPPLGVPEEVGVSGAERTTFYSTVESTAKVFGLAIAPDSNPNAGHYYRSDHFSFARVGVPAFSIGAGDLYQGHDKQWGLQKAKDYVANDYHKPSDEYHPEMDFRSDAVIARFGVALGWQAANQANEVGWKSGDEFDKIRIASGTGR
jgi:Zn-dependent M28 family amino/carboxypeptidase